MSTLFISCILRKTVNDWIDMNAREIGTPTASLLPPLATIETNGLFDIYI